MRVFKFGGASVNSVEAIRNMASIVSHYLDQPLVVVVSAMGKTTNLLERIVPGVLQSDEERRALISQSANYHLEIARQIFECDNNPTIQQLRDLFRQLEERSTMEPTSYNYDYDQVVSFGELISTTLIAGYLNSLSIDTKWVDVRNVILTNENYREGIIDFDKNTFVIK